VAFLENPATLSREGAVLREFENPDQGKMIFELGELTLGVIYLTDSDYRLERFSDLEALLIGSFDLIHARTLSHSLTDVCTNTHAHTHTTHAEKRPHAHIQRVQEREFKRDTD
jgi:hypothetical protein